MKKRPGHLVVICGCMYAGKSEELIRRARRALYAKKSLQVFKPAIDNRYDDANVVTHMGVTHPSIPVSGTAELARLLDPKADVIAIEEVQFFDRTIIDLLVSIADQGKEVIAAGLDQDFRRMPFGPIAELLAVADEVVKLQAICMICGAPANHTQRIINGKPAKWTDPIVLIGATESYEARCRACHKINAPKR
jgi:thymidine kinase